MSPMTIQARQAGRGFTLLEMVVVIIVMAVLAVGVASFIRYPLNGYFDSVRRAQLTEAADVALRRLARDVRLALPNSLRVLSSGGVYYLEFIITSGGARYRDPSDGSTAGTFLSFTSTAALAFDVVGPMPSNPAPAVNDYIVVYNLGSGYSPADAYSGGNRAKISAIAGNLVTLASNPFASQTPPLPSPGAAFQVVPGSAGAVTYSCPAAAAGSLNRYANYGFNTTQAIPGTTPALLASGATCTLEYTANATGRNGLLYVNLTLTNPSSGESISLFQEIHVDNVP